MAKGWLDNYGIKENANEGHSSASDNWRGEGYSNVGRNYSPAWGGQFAEGGEIPMAQKGKKVKPIYVESKNDPRYKAYNDSLNLYEGTKDISKLLHNNPVKAKWKDSEDDVPSKYIKKITNTKNYSQLTKKEKEKVDEWNKTSLNPNIKPYKYETYGVNQPKGKVTHLFGPDEIMKERITIPYGQPNPFYKKPEQPILVKPTTTKETTKPKSGYVLQADGTKFYDESIPAGKYLDYRNHTGDGASPYQNEPQKRKPIKGIENSLQPIGIQNYFNLEAPLPQIRQQVIQPKYYDVEDYTHGSTSYGGTQSNYRTDDLSTLSQQSPNNSRKITPRYAMGGSLPGSVGFTYARTQGAAPSNGKYAKKTKASAQNGEKLDVYDNPLLARRIYNTNIDRSYYDPRFNTMNIGTDYNTWKDEGTGEQFTGEDLKYHQDKLLAHENYHALQHLEGRDNYDIAHDTKNRQWAEMQKRPEIMSTDSVWNNFYNRSALENRQDYIDKINDIPEARLINQNLLFDKVLDRERYNNPSNLEGEAKFYEDTGVGFKNGGKMQYYQNGLDWKPKNISENGGWLDDYEQGGIVKGDQDGYRNPKNRGKVVEILGDTMGTDGYDDTLYVVPDVGKPRVVHANTGNHKFPGASKFTEYPMAKNGRRQEQKGLQNLDNLTNFTNYNKPQPGGWLNKYN